QLEPTRGEGGEFEQSEAEEVVPRGVAFQGAPGDKLADQSVGGRQGQVGPTRDLAERQQAMLGSEGVKHGERTAESGAPDQFVAGGVAGARRHLVPPRGLGRALYGGSGIW